MIKNGKTKQDLIKGMLEDFRAEHVNRTNLGWFEMNEKGFFRILVEDSKGKRHSSYPAHYSGIATLTMEGNQMVQGGHMRIDNDSFTWKYS